LRVVSALLTGEALAELANAEDTLRQDADGVFALADGIAADLASFVWLVLQLQLHASSSATRGNPTDALTHCSPCPRPATGGTPAGSSPSRTKSPF
jgi:hypothetical protein